MFSKAASFHFNYTCEKTRKYLKKNQKENQTWLRISVWRCCSVVRIVAYAILLAGDLKALWRPVPIAAGGCSLSPCVCQARGVGLGSAGRCLLLVLGVSSCCRLCPLSWPPLLAVSGVEGLAGQQKWCWSCARQDVSLVPSRSCALCPAQSVPPGHAAALVVWNRVLVLPALLAAPRPELSTFASLGHSVCACLFSCQWYL